jgi:2,4-dienoyl-CoA reductase-like NADH-dependent reductase (Old Yellow Enzyme family)/thioredoxin reductase
MGRRNLVYMVNSRHDGALSALFSPIKIREMTVKNRIAMAPMGSFYSTLDGALRQEFKDLIVARAKGGVGMILLGDAGFGFTSLEIAVDSDLREQMVKAARELVREIHDYGVRIGVQLNHTGRQIDVPLPGYQLIGPSPIPWSKRVGVPKELTVYEIEQLIGRYVDATERVKEAGFDFVDVKSCHGYLLSSFISPHSNRRDDQYGGDIKGRAGFTLEIIRRIRQKLQKDLLICCRINGTDHVNGGLSLDESKELAGLLVEEGVDFLSVTAGVHGSYPVIIPPYYMPQGCYVHLAEAIKRTVDVPVITVGRIKDPRMANEIIESGKADIVAMARALLADPDLPVKAQRGAFDEIRYCIGCNEGCQDKIEGLETTCLVNPAAGREREMAIEPAIEPKEVMVIGGGLAGMVFAKTAAMRGHKVALYEENDTLGGQWRLACAAPCKEELADYLNYLITRLKKLGVELILGMRATVETVKRGNPDVVVIATGAILLRPQITGIDRESVVTAWDVLAGNADIREDIVVVGGNALGLETADFLSTRGKNVMVIEALQNVGRDLGPTVRWHLRHRLQELGVSILTSTKVIEITQDGVQMVNAEGESIHKDFRTIVLATGSVSRNELIDEVKRIVSEVYVIGDASSPRNALFAIREGAEVGRKI